MATKKEKAAEGVQDTEGGFEGFNTAGPAGGKRVKN
jgi:hypothetical protein